MATSLFNFGVFTLAAMLAAPSTAVQPGLPVPRIVLDPSSPAPMRQRALLELALKTANDNGAKIMSIEKQMDTIDVSTVLSPENLVLPTKVAEAREKVRKLRALLDERQQIEIRHEGQAMEYFKLIEKEVGADAMVRLRDRQQRTRALSIKFHDARLRMNAAAGSLLAWAAAQSNTIKLVDGHIVSTSPEQDRQYTALIGEVRAADLGEQAATRDIEPAIATHAKDKEEGTRRLQNK